MSFVSVAVGIVGEGLAANIMAGGHMGGGGGERTQTLHGEKKFLENS